MCSLSSGDESDPEEIDWTKELQSNRLLIVKNVDYIKLAPALQGALIFDRDDNELISNHVLNPTTLSKANAMVDKLLRKGKENYEKFMEIMGGYYPNVYTKITNRDPPPPSAEHAAPEGVHGEVLSFVFAKLSETRQECEGLSMHNNALRQQITNYSTELEQLRDATGKFEARQERYERLEIDMETLKKDAENMKSEYYRVCMRLVNTSEENSKLREQNMLLKLENDKSVQDRRKLENRIKSERSHSVRLRHQLDTVPSEKDLKKMQQEIQDLRIKVVQSHDTTVNNSDESVDDRIEMLQNDLRDALDHYQEMSLSLNKVREELSESEQIQMKYLEDNETLQLQCTALTDDCKMYKERSDIVWEQKKEVEKERDQLLRERNEAQLTLQSYMDEKTKYRYKIHQLEDCQEKLTQELKENENIIKALREELNPPPRETTKSLPLDLIQQLPSDIDEKESLSETLAMPKRRDRSERSPVRRRAMKPSHSPARSRERSLTDFIREDIFHKLVHKDGRVYELNISVKSIQNQVEFVGGNETGIFFGEVEKGSYADVIGIVPGMKLLKIAMNERSIRELHLRNCTLENVINIFQEIGDSVTISIQYKEEQFNQLKQRCKNGKCSGDSFYVRANFTLRKEGFLQFEKGTVLHVVHTRSPKNKNWIARIVDPYSGEDTIRSGVIPSYRNCISNSQIFKSHQSLNRPLSAIDLTRIFRSATVPQESSAHLTADDVVSRLKCSPYTVVKKAPKEKVHYRPCLFVPRSLSTVLSFKLTTMTEPFQFDLPKPALEKCNEEQAFRRVVNTEAISCKCINDEKFEFVTVEAVQKIISNEKHCILPYNEKPMSIESFVTLLHIKGIYPIILYLTAEKEKVIKFLLQPEQKDLTSMFQDMRKDKLLLDKAVPQYATVNLERCTRLEEAVQQVMELVADETNKIIWISGKSDVQI
uniref:caspase recruitment domain-containing protein 11-like n=1 Tax=Styela clava TaxID=7725 RepID=UPI00193A398C|nr:caspase recruitment domain-containing protein 11-like [Styela clava]